MAKWQPDPTFYPSPRMAAKAPVESLACTSSEHMGPLEPFSKRHFSARTFSSLAC